MHRLIMRPPHGMHVDHINGNGLDNRRANLRICTPRQNNINRAGPQRNTKHGFMGVWEKNDHKRRKRWVGAVKVNGKTICTSHYATPEEAAEARAALAREHYGEFAPRKYTDASSGPRK
jgi:hypothetical protein